MRKPNYRQQKKTREDARKTRQAKKQERRQTPATGPDADAEAGTVESVVSTPTEPR